MQKQLNLTLFILCTTLLSSCSPRDFLTRRLAFDLIAGSQTFRSQQQFQLQTGIISNQAYASPDYAMLQHHGWITARNAPCPPTLTPPPCWDVMLTPSGVETIQSLIAPGEAEKQTFTIPAARRQLLSITGIARQGNSADVEFTWKWVPLNEVGAVLYPSDTHRSTALFRKYDDGWRIVERASQPAQPLDQELKGAEPE